MNVLRFQSCLLVSHKEKRARKIPFHPRATVLRGPNDTGKSSIVKSLYQALGADPAEEHKRWKKADVCSLLTFTLNGSIYHAYRRGKMYGLFHGNELIGRYTSVTEGLGPALANLLNFQLRLPDREGLMVTPPPAYMFLPFYCDQDKGWTDTWASFARLGQFRDWRKEVVSYHTGIRSSRYYEAMEVRARAQNDAVNPTAERTALMQMLAKQPSAPDIDSEIDPSVFKREIEELLAKHNSLSQQREAYKRKISELNARRIQLQAQKEILEKVRAELDADYNYSVAALPEETVECPTCGQVHENTFVERFSIAQDEAKTTDFIGEVSIELSQVLQLIENERAAFGQLTSETLKLQELLSKRHQDVTFHDIVKREGEKEYRHRVIARIDELDKIVAALDRVIIEANKAMKAAESAERRAEVLERYTFLMASYSRTLQADSLGEDDFGNIYFKIRETGSDRPRAILAYMFAILDLIQDGNNTPDCPIILDSPKQQDQDNANHALMLEFIRDRRPEGSQLILCLVDDNSVDFGGDVIELTEKLWVLSADDYVQLAKAIAPYESEVFRVA